MAQAEACAALGAIYSESGNHDKSLKYFEKTFEIARAVVVCVWNCRFLFFFCFLFFLLHVRVFFVRFLVRPSQHTHPNYLG